MNGETDSKGQTHQAFDIIMDMINAADAELKADYLRQRYEEEGWTKAKEQDYLKTLKAAHEKTIEKYEKYAGLEDNGQYDKYLNDDLDEKIGKKLNNERCITDEIGHIRGELKAIENGWRPGELQAMGFVGYVDARIARRKIQYKDNPEKLKEIERFEEVFKKELNDLVWNVNVENPDEKSKCRMHIQNFINSYKNNEQINNIISDQSGTSGNAENFEREISAAQKAVEKEIIEDLLIKNSNNQMHDTLKTLSELDYKETTLEKVNKAIDDV